MRCPHKCKNANSLLALPKEPVKRCPNRSNDDAAKSKVKPTIENTTDLSISQQKEFPKCAYLPQESQNDQQQQHQQQSQENKYNCNQRKSNKDICSYLDDHYINRYRKYEDYLSCNPQSYKSSNYNNTMPINSFIKSCELNKQTSNLSSNVKNQNQTQSTINTNTLSKQQSLEQPYPQQQQQQKQQYCPYQYQPKLSFDQDLRFNQSAKNPSTCHFLQGENNFQKQLPLLDNESYSQLKDQQDYYNIKREHPINAFKRSLRIVLCIIRWQRFTKNTRLQRQYEVTKNQTLDLLIQAVGTAMEYSIQSMKSVLQRLFNEEDIILDYYMHTNQARQFNYKYNKLKGYVIEILENTSKHTVSALTDDNDMIRFLNMQIGTFQFIYEGLYPWFILERLEFSDDTRELRNITENQRYLVAVFFYIIYGLLNRFVDPWRLLDIRQDKVKQTNAQLLLSVIFYLLHDFMKNLVNKNTVGISKNYPAERSNPLYAYPRILESQEQFTLNGFNMENAQSDIDGIINELESQAKINDNIIVGLTPRHLLRDIVERDQEIKYNAAGCFKEIAEILIQKIDSAPPPIKIF